MVFMFGAVLLLSACGKSDEAIKEEAKQEAKEELQDDIAEGFEQETEDMFNNNEEYDDLDVTEDPVEFATGDYDVFENGLSHEKEVHRYVTDDSDDNGMTEIEFDNYKVNLAPIQVESDESGEYIALFGEEENLTDEDTWEMGYNTVSSGDEEADVYDGELGELDPEEVSEIYLAVEENVLDVDSFTLKIYKPEDEDGTYKDDDELEYKEIEFHKE